MGNLFQMRMYYDQMVRNKKDTQTLREAVGLFKTTLQNKVSAGGIDELTRKRMLNSGAYDADLKKVVDDVLEEKKDAEKKQRREGGSRRLATVRARILRRGRRRLKEQIDE